MKKCNRERMRFLILMTFMIKTYHVPMLLRSTNFALFDQKKMIFLLIKNRNGTSSWGGFLAETGDYEFGNELRHPPSPPPPKNFDHAPKMEWIETIELLIFIFKKQEGSTPQMLISKLWRVLIFARLQLRLKFCCVLSLCFFIDW